MISAQRIYESTRLVIRDPDDQRYGIPRFCDALNEAMSDFTNNVDYFVKSEFAEIPPNFNSLDFSRRAVKILRVEYIDIQQSINKRLAWSGFELLDQQYGNWREDSSRSEPIYYVVNKQNPCNFFVYPLAREEDTTQPKFGVIEAGSGNLAISDERGVIESLDKPYLKVIYAELQRVCVPNADNTGIVFEGTTDPAMFNIQEDILHTLKHYCASIMFSDDNDQLQQQLAATQLALYNRKLEQVQEKKVKGFADDVVPVPYMTGTNDGEAFGNTQRLGDNYNGY